MTARWWVAAVGVLVRVVLACLVVVVGVRIAGVERGPALALLVGALPFTLLPAWPIAVGFALRRRWVSAAVAGLVVVAHVVLVLPSVTSAPLPTGGTALRVVTANLYVFNETPDEAGTALRALRPDVLVVPELNDEGLAGLEASGLLADLPHRLVERDERTETVGLFSRYPLHDTAVRRIGGRALPRATVTVDGIDVRVLGAHPLPPVQGLERLWREGLSDLAREVQDVDLPVVVAGDLNSDRDHRPFRLLLEAGLRDVHDERGRGLARTWPAGTPLLHLDHVLVRDGSGPAAPRIGVVAVREVDVPGSDHLGVVADLVVQGRDEGRRTP